MTRKPPEPLALPAHLLQRLELRFGAFDALAEASLGATAFDSGLAPPMDVRTAEAIRQFGDDLREASALVARWMQDHVVTPRRNAGERNPAGAAVSNRATTPKEPVPSGESTNFQPAVPKDSNESAPHDGEGAQRQHQPYLELDDAARRWEREPYDPHGSEKIAHGAIWLETGQWWDASLSVPITGGSDIAFLRIERSGNSLPGYLGDEEADFSVPVAEIDKILLLLHEIVAQARRDGVLPGSGDDPTRAAGQ